MATEQRTKPHAIMISLPYQGHITPFLNLALKLASNGFAVTFVHFEYIHRVLSESHSNGLFFDSQLSGLDISYTTITDGFPRDFDRVLHREEYWKSLMLDFPKIVDEFVGKIVESRSSMASFLVSDTLHSWPAVVAENHGLVNVSFWTEPALVFSLDYHMSLLRENGHFPCEDDVEEEINYIPGVDSICTKDLMSYSKVSGMATLSPIIAIKAFEAVKKADFIVHNTVHELEADVLAALNQTQPNYAIGPINLPLNLPTQSQSQSLWPTSDCTQWLNSRPPGSVLYVSFGSLVQVSEEAIGEIAHGLLLSGVNFLWAARSDTVKSFPDGFEGAINGRGLIVPWCDQIAVLSSAAIGGFLTHCGWNSVLESIWCCVPMICYPLSYDQPVNRKLVVDDWRIGLNLVGDGGRVRRDQVASNVRRLMDSEALREEIRAINSILQKALEDDGCSNVSFRRFIHDLKAKLGLPNESYHSQ